MLHFASPYFLLLLFFIPFFVERKGVTFADSLLIRIAPRLNFSTPVNLEELQPSARAKFRKFILNFLRVVIFASLVIALARPQLGSAWTDDTASGRDIMLVLDVSNSMRALDFVSNGQRIDRMTVLKNVVRDFITKRKGDRIGIVVFGSQAYTQCPLTLDQRALKEYLNLIQTGIAGGETAIGDGIGIALKGLKEIKGDSKVMVLVSDGESNAGLLNPIRSAEIAKELGIKIYTIGIGSSGQVPFPVENMFGRTILTQQTLPVDEKTLKEIADITGGKYFFAQNTEALVKVYDEIDKLEAREEEIKVHITYEDIFMKFIYLAVFITIFYELLVATVFRVVP